MEWTPTSNIPFSQHLWQITHNEYQGQTAPADIVPPDATGNGKTPTTSSGAKVTTGRLIVMMGQVKTWLMEGNKPGRCHISTFENHVRYKSQIHRHHPRLMGPLCLRSSLINGCTRFELWESAISDIIQCYVEVLPNDQFADTESISHDWIHSSLRNLCKGLREAATWTVIGANMKGKGGGGKCKGENSSDEHPPKQLNIEVANIKKNSFAVQVHGDATSGSLFY